ncbi:helicase-related protein [uncultured Thiohalocapsa sp.]|uniref:helicase-related protein n=1 Tax=uncultured Thiohalocapsa sp. TaxID=768990 RepID=UPI0025D7F37D|nr:helicase-related protein [uncultured Thiohalocapsa sp.]
MSVIDNVNNLLGDDLKRTLVPGTELRIAAATFSIFAYEALKAQLEQIDSLKFLFTAPAFVPEEVTDKQQRQPREFHIPKAERERSFYGSEFEIRLRNRLTQRAIARECADWIRRKAQFRSNATAAPMQQFACVRAEAAATLYQPLQGFSAVDLGYQRGEALSSLVTRLDEPTTVQAFTGMFDQLWSASDKVEDVTQRLIDHIASVYQENEPERVYFLMLYTIFNEFLEDLSEDVLPRDKTGWQDSAIWRTLYNFQRDAATGIINKLETFNGCILADSVGLGKTFTALAVIKYYELRNRDVLVLCPKKLADNWLTYNRKLVTNTLAEDRFRYDVLCHTDLQRDSGSSFGTPLNQVNWGNYDLVVIDESHNFRNDDVYKDRETRYHRLMQRVIRAGVKTKVLMLSATPVNNRFSDLKNQLALAYEGETGALDEKLKIGRSVNQVFRQAQRAFNEWSRRPPEERTPEAILGALDFDFFELLDSVTIARSRRHIETFYDTAEIGSFPERARPQSIHSELTHRPDVMGFNAIVTELNQLLLAVYIPLSYVFDSKLAKYQALYDTQVGGGRADLRQEDRERALRALMRVNLLKRLESSVHAFRLTLDKLRRNHAATLARIETFRKTGRDEDADGNHNSTAPDDDLFQDIDDDDAAAGLIGGKVRIALADMDLTSWERDLRADLGVLDALHAEMARITPEHDAKLQDLRTLINSKLASPINPGNRKVLLFTAFADTADYLYANLAQPLRQAHGIHTGKVTGADGPKSTLPRYYDFQSLLTLFAPRAKRKAEILPDEPAELDLLIATDCISEGQNLQDCDYLVNYDIHWNPVRIIQRFGRIDRIGSPNACIQLVNFWPAITLDDYINLKERVENRMVIVDAVGTGNDNPLSPAAENDLAYRKEQLRRLQDEVVEIEDLKTGVAITDLGLNDFRMDLLNYLKTHRDLPGLPNGLHAVVPAEPDKGLVPGVLFVLRNRNHGVNIQQQNRLHPYYLIYLADDGRVVANHREAKRLLDLARAACKGRTEPMHAVCRRFNAATDDGRDMRRCSDLLDAAIHAMIEQKAADDIDSLFTGQRTTALVDDIQGLDDFELINFLVVLAPEPGADPAA